MINQNENKKRRAGYPLLVHSRPFQCVWLFFYFQGVVSRTDLQQYSMGSCWLLAIQIDAAINPGNSGGPALNKEKQCVGIAFQSLKDGDTENIGYIIPSEVRQHKESHEILRKREGSCWAQCLPKGTPGGTAAAAPELLLEGYMPISCLLLFSILHLAFMNLELLSCVWAGGGALSGRLSAPQEIHGVRGLRIYLAETGKSVHEKRP